MHVANFSANVFSAICLTIYHFYFLRRILVFDKHISTCLCNIEMILSVLFVFLVLHPRYYFEENILSHFDTFPLTPGSLQCML